MEALPYWPNGQNDEASAWRREASFGEHLIWLAAYARATGPVNGSALIPAGVASLASIGFRGYSTANGDKTKRHHRKTTGGNTVQPMKIVFDRRGCAAPTAGVPALIARVRVARLGRKIRLPDLPDLESGRAPAPAVTS
jgi:hypothetical protein